jgi:hypothetical protein
MGLPVRIAVIEQRLFALIHPPSPIPSQRASGSHLGEKYHLAPRATCPRASKIPCGTGCRPACRSQWSAGALARAASCSIVLPSLPRFLDNRKVPRQQCTSARRIERRRLLKIFRPKAAQLSIASAVRIGERGSGCERNGSSTDQDSTAIQVFRHYLFLVSDELSLSGNSP